MSNKTGKILTEREKDRYVNREIGWLRFNACVLQEAADPEVPLIERFRFLGIFSNNLDEFYKVRYASIRRAALLKDRKYNNIIDDQTPEELLSEINALVKDHMEHFERLYHRILGELEKENIFILTERSLSEKQKQFIGNFFHEKLSHLIVTFILDDLNEFPHLTDDAFYFAVKMWRAQKKSRYALLEVPTNMFSRFIQLPSDDGHRKYFIFLEDIIRYHLKEIFSIFPFDSIDAYAIKITRDAELSLDNDLSRSFLEKMARSVERRKKGAPVRLVYDKNIPYDTLNYLTGKMELDEYDSMIPGGKYHNRRDLMNFPACIPRLCYEKMIPFSPAAFNHSNSYFSVVDASDQLLCTPYHSFSVFVKFLREAAIDPKVRTIKMTVYRVSDDSQVMNALINAARNGKKVIAMIELRARFDEAHNIYWAKRLQHHGVEIIFGVKGLKVHSKMCYIERVSKGNLKRYAVTSTGNFNEQTAAFYSDFMLFTADPRITREVKRVFEFFDANYKSFNYEHLLLAPNQMRSKLEILIEREIENAKKGLPAYINLKMNSLCDRMLIDQLYRASQAGVKIRIQARSISSLVPALPGLSENIEAISLVDRFLEHSRLYWFAHGGEDLIYISSSDWMPRNLDFRVELSIPVYDLSLKKILQDIFKYYFQDDTKKRSWPDLRKDNLSTASLRAQCEVYRYLKKQLGG